MNSMITVALRVSYEVQLGSRIEGYMSIYGNTVRTRGVALRVSYEVEFLPTNAAMVAVISTLARPSDDKDRGGEETGGDERACAGRTGVD